MVAAKNKIYKRNKENKISELLPEELTKDLIGTETYNNYSSYCKWSDKHNTTHEFNEISDELIKGSDAIFGNNVAHVLSPIYIVDLPKQNLLKNTKLCGYITKDGKYYECEHCEHNKVIRQIIHDEYIEEYLNTEIDFYNQIPNGMWQEEYFAMKKLGWIKISSFKEYIDKMYVFYYNSLTDKQAELVYPN